MIARNEKHRFFVTGGSGYLGRNILRELSARRHAIRALVRSKRSAGVVRDLGAEPVMGDMLERQSLLDGMKGCDRLIHLAADTNHRGYSARQIETNLRGTEKHLHRRQRGRYLACFADVQRSGAAFRQASDQCQ